jgi:phospholipase/carboxylesterase
MSDLLPAIELETAPGPSASVIWLHGLGADGNDFVPIVPELALPPAAAVRFVFPHAPVRPVTINNGMRMRAWYDIAAPDLNNRADITGVRQSQGEIEALITREKARGVPAARIVLAGFSQGGAVALYAGLRHAERLAGILALSTYLVQADKLPAEAATANRDGARVAAGARGERQPCGMASVSDGALALSGGGEGDRRLARQDSAAGTLAR